ncbi:Pkinase-domain-containing protein [Hypoxylon cercidicola]|nr:Pkinase-domain-containing protein [Hypoxylon cercidicola]
MAGSRESSSRQSRAPLGDATARVNNTSSKQSYKSIQDHDLQHNPLRAHPISNHPRQHAASIASTTAATTTKIDNAQARRNSRASSVSRSVQGDRRNSQASQVSLLSASSDGRRRKTRVGPWELGKTLGSGSAAKVKLVRHTTTHELAAVKILSRRADSMTQPGSIVALDKWDRSRAEYKSENRIPLAIEREVAIMKLIDHQHIVKLYDIWENRSEIYLVLEYVGGGDLYTYIGAHGRLSEVETVSYFRQILSALDYVHSFNLCHRDLKPENILLTEDGQVKVTDFGMSALHQSPYHMLRTACGSPHYAAPELVGSSSYRGDKVDLWSLGVILFACLSCTLPFNDDVVPRLLAKVQKGKYRMPAYLSHEVQDLISRMLVVDPNKRISSPQIWEHELLRKYNHLDDLNEEDLKLDHFRNARYDPVPAEEIDMQTLRQLKSVWHTFTEAQIATRLVNSDRNDFKLFYWLLCSYREKRLENYNADLAHSPSDYHHLRPPNWKKKYTTLDFPGKFGRMGSRFTVISNVATDLNGNTLDKSPTDGGATVASYDPYKSSRILEGGVASKAKIVIHRNGTTSTRASKAPSVRSMSARTNSTMSRRDIGVRHAKAPSTLRGSRRSLSSIRSGEEISYRRPASSRRKRGVDFSQARKRSVDQGEAKCRPASIAGDDTTYARDHTCFATSPSKKSKLSGSGRSCSGTQSMTDVSEENVYLHWNEELRQFSSSIAKDCDDAFNSTLLSSDAAFESPISQQTPSIAVGPRTPTPTARGIRGASENVQILDARPLPPAPSPSHLDTYEMMTAKKRAVRLQSLRESSQPKQVSQPSGRSGKVEADRRVVSAPIYSQYSTQWGKDKIPLPPINEASREDDRYGDSDRFRVVSAPAAESSTTRITPAKDRSGLDFLAQHEHTIRLVNTQSNRHNITVAPAAPSVGMESAHSAEPNSQSGQGPSLRQQYLEDEMSAPIPVEPTTPTRDGSANNGIKKKSSWFKRGSKEKSELLDGSSLGNNNDLSRTETASSAGPSNAPVKKKSFGFNFWRGSKEQPQLQLSLAGSDIEESPSPKPARMFSHPSRPLHNKKWADKAAARNIEPQQSWLARLFRVKPATRYLCFAISRRRVRQEIGNLLKEWRRHGMKDIMIDKERNLVFARVAKRNHLNLKEATFAAEIMTVIEHGKRNQLCIVRFTQERGAATTFHKVIDTMDEVFNARGLLIVDKHKTKMMIKTLNA